MHDLHKITQSDLLPALAGRLRKSLSRRFANHFANRCDDHMGPGTRKDTSLKLS
jgi:hypothetical protein